MADEDAWQYFYFDPVYNGIDWRPTPEADVYEMVFVRNPTLERFQFVFKVFPKLQEFSPKDLYKKHPTKPHHWRHIGRVDDILVFSNGEKMMPRITEDLLSAHPAIRSALVVGRGRFNAAAILEPNEIPETQLGIKSLLEGLWETVMEANKIAPTHGMLSKSHLMIVSPNKPFLRAGKGMILSETGSVDTETGPQGLYGEEQQSMRTLRRLANCMRTQKAAPGVPLSLYLSKLMPDW